MSGQSGQTAAVFGADSRAFFEQVLDWLEDGESVTFSHSQLEEELEARGRELLRALLQDHLSLRTATEARLAVVTDTGVSCTARSNRAMPGSWPVCSGRLTCNVWRTGTRGHHNLHPADAPLNLPTERHSQGLRRLAAIESSRGSFEQAGAAITRATGQHVGKSQVEELAARAAADVADF